MTVPAPGGEIPFYIAIDGNEIEYVGFGKPLKSQGKLVTGDIAFVLYRAIAGHDYNETTDLASSQRAIIARRCIYNNYFSITGGSLDAAQKALLKLDDNYYWPGFWQVIEAPDGSLIQNTNPPPKDMPELSLYD